MSADKQAQIVDPDPSAKTRVSQDADPTAAGVQATLGGSDPEIDGEPHPAFDGLVDVRPDSEGSEYHLQRCPLCPESVFVDAASVDNHIASHDPADFGLDGGDYGGIAPELHYDDPEAVFGDDEGAGSDVDEIRETDRQIAVLGLIDKLERPTYSELADELGVASNSISRSTGVLRAKGYVKFDGAHQDGQIRRRLFALTSDGRAVLQERDSE